MAPICPARGQARYRTTSLTNGFTMWGKKAGD